MQGGAAIVLPPRLAGSRGWDLDGAQPVRGADSLSARFAAARTPALRSRGNTAATRENAIPAPIANPCRGRCSHCARRRVSEANRTAGPALRPEIVPGCSRRRGVCGRGMPLPYMASGHDRPNGIAAAARANVGRDALIPPHPAAGQCPAGGINPAPTGKFCVLGKPGSRNVCPGLQGRPRPSRGGPRQGRPGRYGIGPYMGCLRRRECSRF